VHNYKKKATGRLINGEKYFYQAYFGVQARGYNPVRHVCYKNLCKAILNYSPKKGAKTPVDFLIGVINEAAKHKGDNPVFRGLEKHFARHARSVHQR
jgi:hypothetical protein